MKNWYKTIKEADKESFLISQKPKSYSLDFWSQAVKWALGLSKKHAVWLTNLIRKNSNEFIFGEDDYKVKEALEVFDKARRKKEFPTKDINQFKSYQDLVEAIEPYMDVKSNRQQQTQSVQEGLKLMDEDNGYKLFQILNFEAAHAIAQNTQWCVTHRMHYENYAKEGPMFYISKSDEPYCLTHPGSRQFKNKRDGSMNKVRHYLFCY